MSMTVISIDSEPHGHLGLAKSREAAIQWLIDAEWITKHSEIWSEERQVLYSLAEMYGEEWIDKVFSFNSEELENLGFYLGEEEVYE